MRFLRANWCPLCLGLLAAILILVSVFPSAQTRPMVNALSDRYREGAEWIPPDAGQIPLDSDGDLIRYGKELIANTSKYLGPKGVVAALSNGMNCQNCHLAAGTQNFANPFSGTVNNYPKYRERSGRVESFEFRVNDCMKRSMNGEELDSSSTEMRAMVAYIKWVGKNVPKGVQPVGMGTRIPPLLNRAADPAKGKIVFMIVCQRCHGADGQGVLAPEGNSYTYPPLWGPNSFNTGAGLFRLSTFAGYVKNNMPFQEASWKNPVLTDEQAWDVAAFVVSQPRPEKTFASDWKDVSKKPFDYPFGPYKDGFSELAHKYGPFQPIKNAKATGGLVKNGAGGSKNMK